MFSGTVTLSTHSCSYTKYTLENVSIFVYFFPFTGVLALETYDITADGIPDVLVGRDDGLIEVYGFDEMDEPVHRFKQVTRIWNFVLNIILTLKSF